MVERNKMSLKMLQLYYALLISFFGNKSDCGFTKKIPYFFSALISILIAAPLLVAMVMNYLNAQSNNYTYQNNAIVLPSLSSWASIGGCGAGGSGSGSDDGIKWIGNGVSGGLVELEVLPKLNIGQNFKKMIIAPRLSFKPSYTTGAGITIPITSSSAEVQYQTNEPPNDRTTGGLGDISLDLSKNTGLQGQYLVSLTLSLPVGQYDIKRGTDADMKFLPNNLQKGSGVYNAGILISRSFDVENGLWMVDLTYNHPFAMRPFTKKNEFLDIYYSEYKDQKSNKRFYYTFKPYGENDLGGYIPPSAGVKCYYAYRGIPGRVHSFGVAFNAPFAVAWIPNAITEMYAPGPDPDHKSWNASLMYGLEFSKPAFPLYIACSKPIHDKKDPLGNWDAPDWKDFLDQWTFAVGFKSTFF
jgi:hypothetical protein